MIIHVSVHTGAGAILSRSATQALRGALHPIIDSKQEISSGEVPFKSRAVRFAT